jgi:hypothetical protein
MGMAGSCSIYQDAAGTDQTKARKAIPVPLLGVAVAVIRKQIGKHQVYVFSYRGKPVYQVNSKAWHKALRRIA